MISVELLRRGGAPVDEAVPWDDRDQLRGHLIALASEAGEAGRRATHLLAALPHPESTRALVDLGLSAPYHRSRAACSALADIPELSLSADTLAGLLDRAPCAPLPGPPTQTARLLRVAVEPEARAAAKGWLSRQTTAHLDQLMRHIRPVPDALWEAWRERLDADAPPAEHAAINAWERPAARRLLLTRLRELTAPQRARLLRALKDREPATLAADFEGRPEAARAALEALLLPPEALAALFDVEAVLERCEDALHDAEDAMATLAGRELERQERFARVVAVAAQAPLVTGTLTEAVKGGWTVDIGMRAYLPGSQLADRRLSDKASHLGERRVFRVLKLHPNRGLLVLSALDLPDPLPPGPLPLDDLLWDAPPHDATLDGVRLGEPDELSLRALAILSSWPAAAETVEQLIAAPGLLPWALALPLRRAWLAADPARALTWARSLIPGELRQEAVSQHAVARALAPTEADRPLLKWLQESDCPIQRYAAVHGLDALGDPPRPTEDAHPLVRVRALAARARAGDDRAHEALLDCARGAREATRAEALRWLAEVGPPAGSNGATRAALEEAMWADLENPDFLFAHSAGAAAAVGLARLDEPSAWQALLSACLSAPYEAGEALLAILERGLRGLPIAPVELLSRHDLERRFRSARPPR